MEPSTFGFIDLTQSYVESRATDLTFISFFKYLSAGTLPRILGTHIVELKVVIHVLFLKTDSPDIASNEQFMK